MPSRKITMSSGGKGKKPLRKTEGSRVPFAKKNGDGKQGSKPKKFSPADSAKGSPTFNTTKEQVIQFIQKTFDNPSDIVDALSRRKAKDFTKTVPTLGAAASTDPDAKKIEQRSLDITFELEMKNHFQTMK